MKPTDSQLESQDFDSNKRKSLFTVRNTALVGVGAVAIAGAGVYTYREEIFGKDLSKDDKSVKTDELNALKSKIETLNKEIDLHTVELGGIAKKLNKFKTNADTKANEKLVLEKKFKELEHQIAKLEADKTTKTEEINAEKAKLETLKKEKEDLKAAHDASIAEKNEKIKDLDNQLVAKNKEIENAKIILGADNQKKLIEFETEKDRLVKAINAAKEENRKLVLDHQAQVAQIEKEISDLEAAIAELDYTKTQISQMEEKVKDLTAELENGEDIATLETKFKELEEKMKADKERKEIINKFKSLVQSGTSKAEKFKDSNGKYFLPVINPDGSEAIETFDTINAMNTKFMELSQVKDEHGTVRLDSNKIDEILKEEEAASYQCVIS